MSLPSHKIANDTGANQLDTTILELLTSRICHDIISPVGAVENGVEFLQDMGADAGDEAIDLIAHSARQASVKLQAFRMAYGAGGRDSGIKPENVHKVFANLIEQDGKVTQTWGANDYVGFEEIPAGYCKILMGAMMLALECMPKGGTVKVTEGSLPETSLIIAEGINAAPRPNFVEALNQELEIESLTPHIIHPYVLNSLATNYDLKVSITSINTGKVEITLSKAI